MANRFFDVLLASVALIILSPIIGLCALFVRIKLGSPVIFKQYRPGLNEKIFLMYKFRSMENSTDKFGNQLSDTKRLSSFGKKLRATSLDELPELWNVLKGDMSIVGPRPLLPEYLDLYNNKQRKRHLVKPGITGWAQINGRNAISWKDKFELDVWYVENKSFLLDIKIICLTIKNVILKKDINSQDSCTSEIFKGNDYE